MGVIGYLIIFGIALAFIIVGGKGFSKDGIPLTQTSRLKGAAGKTVGALLILIGLGIAVLGIWDVLATMGIVEDFLKKPGAH